MSPSTVTIYVDPRRGNDQNQGDATAPLKTLTKALARAKAASTAVTIQLGAGQYTTATGEQFPLQVPKQVVVTGDAAQTGETVEIQGGGTWSSPEFGQQAATLVFQHDAELRGVTVTNPLAKGSGLWIEDASPAIAHCTFQNCRREGIFVLGKAHPLILSCRFLGNAASGMFFARQAKGEVLHSEFQGTGYGIAISDQAAPLVSDNHLLENRAGIVISRSARPVLRNNWIARNQTDGLTVLDTGLPDLGDDQDDGRNRFEANGQFDIRNRTSTTVISGGNQVNPVRLSGPVKLVSSRVPPVKPMGQAEPAPLPAPVPVIEPIPPTPRPTTQRVTFPDIERHWARPFIETLTDREIIRGFPDGTFRPDAQLTRAEYAVLLTKAFPLPARQVSQGFVDVPPAFWAAPAILTAARAGLLAGFPDGTFLPQAALTRLQILLSLVNGLGLQGGHLDSLQVYRDRAQIPSYAVNVVAIATQNRLVVNYPQPDLLEPAVPASRGETAAMIYQAFVALGQAPAISSPYIIKPSAVSASFSDIQTHWAAPFIQGMASQGLLGGFPDGTFKPETAMSRAHFAVLIAKTFNPLPKRPPARFVDVPASFWAAPAIQQAYQGGWLSGYGDGSFQPQQDVLRMQVLLALVQGLELPEADPAILKRYVDAGTLPATLQQAIARAATAGLIINPPEPDRLELSRGATRGEVAAMVYQALVYLSRAQPVTPTVATLSP